MIILVPTSFADAIWVDLQKYLFNEYSEDGLISAIEEEDVIAHGVDALFMQKFGKSIFEVAVDFKEERELRIYDYVKSAALLDYEGPDINYKSEIHGSFDWEQTFLFGRLLRSIGYAMGPNGARIDTMPVVCIVFDYTIDSITSGYVSRREKIVRLYRNDGTLSYTKKIMQKNYPGQKGPNEAERRRRNIINLLQKEIQDFLILGGASEANATAASQGFIQTIKQEVNDYIIWAFKDILTAVQNHTSPLMGNVISPGVTIRDFILGRIDYWTYEEIQNGQYKGSSL